MRYFMLTLCLLFTTPAWGQMATFGDQTGRQGQVFGIGPQMGAFSDNAGQQGTYQSFGSQGMWNDNQGRSGQWMDIGPNQKAFTDNQGGHGMTFQNGPNLGMYHYQTPSGGTQQGQYFQYGR